MAKLRTPKLRREYHVTVERSGDGRWVVDFGDEPVFTYGVHLEQAKRHSWEALACHLDTDLEDLPQRTNIVFDIKLSSTERQHLKATQKATANAETSRELAKAQRTNAVVHFVEAGMTSSDIGSLLGVTRQRANVLVRDALASTHRGRRTRSGGTPQPH